MMGEGPDYQRRTGKDLRKASRTENDLAQPPTCQTSRQMRLR